MMPPRRPTVYAPDGKPLHWRHLDVLRLGAEGLTQAEMGRRLFIGRYTVQGYSVGLLRATCATNMAHAVAIGFRTGILE